MTSIGARGTGLLLGDAPGTVEDLHRYRAAGGYAPAPGDLLEIVGACGLRGRGGAGFPLADKLRAVRERPGPRVVVANGEEGEPGSVKDRHLMRARPHLVIDGLLRAASLVGADRGYAYTADPVSAARLRAALAEFPPHIPITVMQVEHTYVAGEESALVRFLNGGPALPTAKPPRPFERGVGGDPTLVANVETLAHLALLAAGRPATGDMLVTLSGAGFEPVLAEIAIGTTLRSILDGIAAAGTVQTAGVTGALVGGLFGGLLGAEVLDLPISAPSYAAAGAALGCGAIHLLGPDDCPVAVAADALSFLAAESSRQCGICVSGTRALADTLAGLASGTGSTDVLDRLAPRTGALIGRGACGLLDAAARVAASLLRVHGGLAYRHLEAACPRCRDSPPAAGARLQVAPTQPQVNTPEGARA